MTRFRAGDVVRVPALGEFWQVAATDELGDVFCSGWPDTFARAADCQPVKAASDAEHVEVLRIFAASDGRRASHARRELARIDRANARVTVSEHLATIAADPAFAPEFAKSPPRRAARRPTLAEIEALAIACKAALDAGDSLPQWIDAVEKAVDPWRPR